MKPKRASKRGLLPRKPALRRRLNKVQPARGEVQSARMRLSASPVAPRERIRKPQGVESPSRLMFETMNQGVLILTAEGSIVYANPCFAKMVKVPLQEIPGLRLHDFVTFAHRRKIAQLLQKSRRGAQVEEIILWARDKNIVVTLFSVGPLGSAGASRICAVVTDLSAFIAAHRVGLKLASIVQSSGDAILSVTAGGVILTWNEAAQRTFGYKAAEAVGRRVEMLIPNDHHAGRQALVVGETLRMRPCPYETVMVRKDGARMNVAVTVSPIEDAPGESAVIIRDVTVRMQRETQLRELTGKLLVAEDEERRRIAQELHDSTAQNLAAINIGLAMLANALQRDEGNRRRLEEIAALARQCSEEIRDLARLLHPPSLDVVGLSSALRGYAEHFTRRCGIPVDLDIPPQLGGVPSVMAGAIFRVVQEALMNIYRHSGSATARLRIFRDASGVRVEVADHGKGMPRLASRAAVGTPFQTGMGLHAMRERVELLGGRLDISSNSHGVTVKASFPLPAIDRGAVSTEPPAASNM